MKKSIQTLCVIAIVACLCSAVLAVDIATVPVGNVGNLGEWSGESYGGYGVSRLCGAVDQTYNIAKYEVTNTQYAEFLNAVATVGDPHDLYSTDMGGGWNDGGGISRSGSGIAADPWVYAIRANRGNRPVNYVTWYDTLRFCNWLYNDQPRGTQDDDTTENGSYDMSLGSSVVRKPGATWILPTEDEWYKAAYYDPGKDGGAGYWNYATASDTAPTAESPTGTDLVNGSANFYNSGYVDTTYYTTEVGAYTAKPSDSAYGTFDQSGNVWEWNETLIGSSGVRRGGSFGSDDSLLLAASRFGTDRTNEGVVIGFRVAQVPEPATLSLLTLGGLALVRRRKLSACK